jgi:hypothetical protein
VRLLSTNRPPQSVKSPVHSSNELWNAFGACGGLMGVKCHSRLPTSSNSLEAKSKKPPRSKQQEVGPRKYYAVAVGRTTRALGSSLPGMKRIAP